MDWWTQRPSNSHRAVRASSRPSVTEISPLLLIGEYPRLEDIEWLKREFAITVVHNLQDDEDLRIHDLHERTLAQACDAHGIRFVRTPIQDGSADAMAERLQAALDDLARLVQPGERVYMHCNAGLNRAPTLAIAYLRAFCNMSLNEALAHVKERRACGPFMTVLEDYFGPRDQRSA